MPDKDGRFQESSRARVAEPLGHANKSKVSVGDSFHPDHPLQSDVDAHKIHIDVTSRARKPFPLAQS